MRLFSDLLFIAVFIKGMQQLTGDGLLADSHATFVTLTLSLILGWANYSDQDKVLETGSVVAKFIREGMAVAVLIIFVGVMDRVFLPIYTVSVVGAWVAYGVGRVLGGFRWLLAGAVLVALAYAIA